MFYLLHVLPQQNVFGVLVFDWSVLYELGPTRINESTQSFLVVCRVCSDGTDHNCFGVSSQRILKNSGQFWVPIGDIYLLTKFDVRETVDDFPQSRKWKINFRGLFYSFFFGLGLVLPLRPCKINQIQFSYFEFCISMFVCGLFFNFNWKNAVRPGRFFVHSCLPNRTIPIANFEKFLKFFNALHNNRLEILYHESFIGIFFDVQICFDILSKQIVNIFVINFSERASDEMLLVLLTSGYCDYLIEGSRNYAF